MRSYTALSMMSIMVKDDTLYSPGGRRSMLPSRKSSCAHCKEGITPDKRLYSCTRCHRYYHPGCYGRTLPGKPIDSPNWTCRRCIQKKAQRGSANFMGTTRSRDHDSKSTSLYCNTAKTFTPAGPARQAVDMASGPGGSFTPNSNDEGLTTGECAVPKCSARSMPDRNLCSLHLGEEMEQSQTLRSSHVHGPAHHTTKASLPLDHGPPSVLPVTRRKTGSTGGVVRPPSSVSKSNGSGGGVIKPSSFYSKPNGSIITANKPTQGARSPPDSSDESGPVRKKPRLDRSHVGSSAEKPDVASKKPWNTGFNPRPTTKPQEEAHRRTGKSSETGGNNNTKHRLPTNRTQRKFAPKIELALKNSSGTEHGPKDRPLCESPRMNGSAARETTHSTDSPQSHGKEFVGNESVIAWYEQRESVKPERRSQPFNTLTDSKSPFFSGGASLESPAPVGSTKAVVNERRATPVSSWVLPPSLVNTSPKGTPKTTSSRFFQPQLPTQSQRQQTASKLPSLSQQHLDGWAFVPAPAPNKAQPPIGPGQRVSDLDFDSLIYCQAGAASPPRGISVNLQKIKKPPPPPQPEPPDEPFYAHIDPRVHWPQQHSPEWYEKKIREIRARGGRKARFGKAAQRLKQQREQEGQVSFEDSLPEKIRENPAWLRALKELHEDQPQEESLKKRGGQRGSKAGRQGLKRQPSTAGPTTPRKS
ncbi:hypothetical protein BR93DRAFT_232971 [Coniochaeta sp. PMI_546]|nr:hypothetical protein BR93DRAFT_232971 [Coniochaeta sp. PMI_546]